MLDEEVRPELVSNSDKDSEHVKLSVPKQNLEATKQT